MSLKVFSTYNRAMTEHGLVPYQKYSTHRSTCERFVAWCEKRHIDPVRWLLARHEAIQWRYKVPLKSLHSDRFLEKFREWGDAKQAVSIGQARLAKSMIMQYELSSAMREAARSRMSAQECFDTATIGDRLTFHDASSPTCQRCPWRGHCERPI